MEQLDDKQFRALFEQHSLLAACDINGNIIYINANFIDYLSFLKCEIVGKNIAEIFEEFNEDNAKQLIWNTLLENKSWSGEVKIKFESNAAYWLQLFLFAQFDKNDTFSQVLIQAHDISARKSQDLLTRRFREVLNQSNDSIFITRVRDAQIIDVNLAACLSLQYTREELLQMKAGDVEVEFKINNSSDWVNHIDEIQQKAPASLINYGTHQRKDGTTFPVEVTLKHHDFEGEAYIFAICRDVSQKRAIEEALKKNEANLKALVNNSEYAIWAIDIHFNLIVFNEQYAKFHYDFYGQYPEKGFSLTHKPIFYDGNFWFQTYQSCFKGEKINTEFLFSNAVYQLSFMPIRQEEIIVGVSVYAQNITERKEAEQSIINIKNNLEESQDIAKLGVWYFDLQKQEIEWSKQVFLSFGLNPDEVTPDFETYKSLIHPNDLDELLKVVHLTATYGIEYELEVRHKQPDGTYRWVLAKAQAIKNDNDEIIAIKGTVVDIHKLKEIEENLWWALEKEKKLNEELAAREEELAANEETLRQVNQILAASNEELTKINTELDRFVYSASHDLRAPIASLLGLISLCRMTDNVFKINEYLDLQEISIRRLDNFIRDILDYSQNTRLEIRNESIDLKELTTQVLEQYAFLENFERIEKKIKINQKRLFYSDGRRISVILNNLFSNAIRYANIYQENPFVEINIEVLPEMAVIVVKDNGIGIDEEHHHQIFEMFYRATTHKSGSGLGLYIVKETLQKLKGTIEVSSKEGNGTTFLVKIPNLDRNK
jgi:PAS domain S-box-containing protein